MKLWLIRLVAGLGFAGVATFFGSSAALASNGNYGGEQQQHMQSYHQSYNRENDRRDNDERNTYGNRYYTTYYTVTYHVRGERFYMNNRWHQWGENDQDGYWTGYYYHCY